MSTPLVPPPKAPPAEKTLVQELPGNVGRNQDSTTNPTKKSRYGWIGWLLFAGACGAGWFYQPYWRPIVQKYIGHEAAAPAAPPVRVVAVNASPAIQRDFDLYINGLGTVTAFNTVTIRSRVEGEVINVAFQEGQMVQEGDLLAEIDPRPYAMMRDQALAQIARDDATLKLAEVTLQRQLELMKSQASTPQLVDQQIAQVDQAKAALQLDQAQLENARLQLEYCRIVAPISGRIGLRLVDKGNIVQANSATGIAVITQLEPISLTFTISQDEIPRVQRQIGLNKSLVVEAFDRDFRTQLAVGYLAAIDNQVDATTGTLRLKATFDNHNHILFPNQFVNARLHIDTVSDAILIPTAAVQRGPDRNFVYVVKPDSTVEQRVVIIGPSEKSETSIQEGLKAGELVVTNGLDKLRTGSKISLPNKNGSSGKPDASKPSAPQAGGKKGEA